MKQAARELLLPRSLTDADLVAAIGTGDLSGLGVLFDRHGSDVRRLLLRLGAGQVDVDDLVQQTFLDLLRSAHRFRQGAPVRPWLFGLAAMVRRRHRRALRRMIDHLRVWALEQDDSHAPPPSEAVERSAFARRAQRALEGLSAKKREAFVLVVLEGLSGEEAAAALDIPVMTVWTRLHYARAELRDALASENA
ncbi:RNA polymerase sigma factor RpoE [Labilithrix luteola]|uniref:RNA polymerase sigma factor RpoE n=1 Tax=Labilithrix luteola TaxID=1391654 RepID=A0A0K1Q4Z3_9BACT|nr:RNA polymerase sigma factor [Labilithrix luteola]AKV00480.1 RNA polymerase sigma factor RpoE [Labilithrix luteola]